MYVRKCIMHKGGRWYSTRSCESIFAFKSVRGTMRTHLSAREVEQLNHIQAGCYSHKVSVDIQKKWVSFALGEGEGLLRCTLMAANLHFVALAKKNILRMDAYDRDVGTLGGENADMLHLKALTNELGFAQHHETGYKPL